MSRRSATASIAKSQSASSAKPSSSVGHADVADGIFAGQGGGLCFFSAAMAFSTMPIFGPSLAGWQTHHRHFGNGQMRGDLCPPVTPAPSTGGFADDKVFCGHGNPLSFVAFGFQTASVSLRKYRGRLKAQVGVKLVGVLQARNIGAALEVGAAVGFTRNAGNRFGALSPPQ